MDDFIPTRVSRTKKDAVNEFVSVKYEKPKRRKVDTLNESAENNGIQNGKFRVRKIEENEDNDEKKKRDLEMKRLRFEVIKFGMSGLKGTEAKDASVELAVSLGAKPPKSKGINYKLLQIQRKKEKQGQQMQKQEAKHKKNATKHSARTDRKDSDGILKVYGRVNKKLSRDNRK